MSNCDLLVRAREDWFVGRWSSLRLMTPESIEEHSSRADLAVFVAAAWQQINDIKKVKLYVSLALSWGMPIHTVSQFLVAGVYNTLSCAKAIQNPAINPLCSFEQAVDIESFSGLDTATVAGLRMREQLKESAQSDLPFYFPPLEDEVRAAKTPAVSSISSFATVGNQHQLFVLGMHRSGTSCLTNLLKNMGAYFGDDNISTGKNDENPRGFWERRDMRQITDKLLFSVDADWCKVANFKPEYIPSDVVSSVVESFDGMLSELNENSVWVLKEPRLCLLLPLLRESLQQPLAVCIYRNPIEVALSLQKRNGFPLVFGLALWEFYTTSMLKNTSDMNRVFISYNKLMNNPVESVFQLWEALTSFGVPLSIPDESQLPEIVDPSLYRNRIESRSLEGELTVSQFNLHRSIEVSSGQLLREFSDASRDSLAFFEKGVFGV